MKKSRQKRMGVVLALACLLAGCSAPSQQNTQPAAVTQDYASRPTVSSSVASSTAEEAKSMTLEQQVGQLFFLSFRKDEKGANVYTCGDSEKKLLQEIQPGGVALFGENIATVQQVRQLIQQVQQVCATPPFIGVDQEGGSVQRVARSSRISATVVPPMWKVGQTGNPALARQVGGLLGSELRVFGFNLDFAPVCDVFSNPENTVIGTRAFSSDPQQAAVYSKALSAGLRGQGVVPVCKHFPGHGDTIGDTHQGYAVVNKTLEELRKTELVPFQAQIRAGAEMIMAAHISLPKVNGDDTPASLSAKVLQGLLRKELGFTGVIVTDALDMGAITQHYSSGEAAVRAVEAGADMLLMPENPHAAYQAVLQAVRSGKLSKARIAASVQRILTLKEKYDLFSKQEPADERLLGCKEHRQVVAQIG